MNIVQWKPFFKLDEYGHKCMAQQTYEPLINPEGTVFCANYDYENNYQRYEENIRPLYTKELVEYFFNREVYYIKKYQDKPYMPEVIDIDQTKKRIFFRWNNLSCNHIIYKGQDLTEYCRDWKDQIKNIEVDLYRSGTYKLTMYPHCHFIDSDGKMKSIDWYGCVSVEDPYIESQWMDGIIHHTARFRLDETGDIVNGKYNLKKMFQGSMGKYVTWGEHSMRDIYKEIFGEYPQ